MALNPFFLRGSAGEQRLVQDLINEQLRMFGVEITYLPRKIVNRDNIFREVESSKFDDNFLLEAYVNTYEGYTGAGDIMTKFGMSLKDELVVTISKERWEDFIAPFLVSMSSTSDEIVVEGRPREGDLIYFPLGKRIFEVKFVEHEKPFYQLGKGYVYELQCELYELSDDVGGWNQLSDATQEIDETLVNYGYMTELQLISIGSTATLNIGTSSGYIRNIFLNEDGYGYTTAPNVVIDGPGPVGGGITATAVAITTSVYGVHSVKEILLTNAGAGYTTPPTVTIVSTATTATNGITTYNGVGAAATANLGPAGTAGIQVITTGVGQSGSGYADSATVFIDAPPVGVGNTIAVARAVVDKSANMVTQILISDAGVGYTSHTGIASVSQPATISGIGTYQFNEAVQGTVSGAIGRVKSWDRDEVVLKLGTTSGTFQAGEIALGTTSGARYNVDYIKSAEFADQYDQSDNIESEADAIIDFSETNPFGQV